MIAVTPSKHPYQDRFIGFDVLDQAGNWDPVTEGVVLARIGMATDIRFFTPAQQAIATVLCDHLLDQCSEGNETADVPRIAMVNQIDARLAEEQTDGWHYEDMPTDGCAWRDTMAMLEDDAMELFGVGFVACERPQQAQLIQGVQDRGSGGWHGLNAKRVWSLWTRYACTAFYSHPLAWNEMGFPGPAYPRGYKNTGVDKLEPFEVRDVKPQEDPAGGSQ